MAAPLVSVLMTAFNREGYIANAIKSVLASTYRDIELIVCDDNSKDKTVSIVRQLMSTDARIKLYINPENLGDYKNRNKAATYATGKYLKYVDADDMVYPWGLEIMVDCMEQFPDAGYGLCSMPQDQALIYPSQLSPGESYRGHYLDKMGIFTRAPLSSIIKKSAFEAVGGFTPLRMVGDFEMWHRLSLHFPVVLMPQGMVWYRKHGDQEMNLYANYEFDYKRISLDYLNNVKCPLTEAEKEAVIKNILKNSSRRLLKYLAKGNLSLFNRGKKVLDTSLPAIIKNALA